MVNAYPGFTYEDRKLTIPKLMAAVSDIKLTSRFYRGNFTSEEFLKLRNFLMIYADEHGWCLEEHEDDNGFYYTFLESLDDFYIKLARSQKKSLLKLNTEYKSLIQKLNENTSLSDEERYTRIYWLEYRKNNIYTSIVCSNKIEYAVKIDNQIAKMREILELPIVY